MRQKEKKSYLLAIRARYLSATKTEKAIQSRGAPTYINKDSSRAATF